MLGAELGPQPPHVHVDRAGAAEVVVAPDLLHQVRAGEDPARVLGQELQQLELLVGEVERAALQAGGVGRLVDGQIADVDVIERRRGGLGPPLDGQPQPGFELGRAGGVEHDVVDGPVGREGDQAALGQHGDDRHRQLDRGQHPGERARGGQVAAGVEQHQVAAGALDQGAGVEGQRR